MDSHNWVIGAMLNPHGTRLDFVHETLIADEHRHLKMIVYFEAAPAPIDV